jgi:hypothetical protein
MALRFRVHSMRLARSAESNSRSKGCGRKCRSAEGAPIASAARSSSSPVRISVAAITNGTEMVIQTANAATADPETARQSEVATGGIRFGVNTFLTTTKVLGFTAFITIS